MRIDGKITCQHQLVKCSYFKNNILLNIFSIYSICKHHLLVHNTHPVHYNLTPVIVHNTHPVHYNMTPVIVHNTHPVHYNYTTPVIAHIIILPMRMHRFDWSRAVMYFFLPAVCRCLGIR